MPAGVQKEKIESEYKDGILEIHIPKAEEVKPKEIEVKVKQVPRLIREELPHRNFDPLEK